MKLEGDTFGETLGPAMEITDETEADDYFLQLVNHYLLSNHDLKSREEAERVVRENLGYYAGYYSAEIGERVNRLFRTTHPIFGGTRPTPEEAFKAGEDLGKKLSE